MQRGCRPRKKNRGTDTSRELLDHVARTSNQCRDAVLDLIGSERIPVSAKDVARNTGCSVTSARNALKALEAEGFITLDNWAGNARTRAKQAHITQRGIEAWEARQTALEFPGDGEWDPDAAWEEMQGEGDPLDERYEWTTSEQDDGILFRAFDLIGFDAEGNDYPLVGELLLARDRGEAHEGRRFGVEDFAAVRRVWVSPDHRDQGLGTRLYEMAARAAMGLGLPLASAADRSRAAGHFWAKQKRKGRADLKRARATEDRRGASRYVTDYPPPLELNPPARVRKVAPGLYETDHFEIRREEPGGVGPRGWIASKKGDGGVGASWYPTKAAAVEAVRAEEGPRLTADDVAARIRWLLSFGMKKEATREYWAYLDAATADKDGDTSRSRANRAGRLHNRGIGMHGANVADISHLIERRNPGPPDWIGDISKRRDPSKRALVTGWDSAPAYSPPRREEPVVLVGCAKSKLGYPAPARELYTSHLFRLARLYAEQSGHPWAILSAEHGLVLPDQVLAPYDTVIRDLDPDQQQQWAFKVDHGLRKHFPGHGRVIVLAGSAYTRHLPAWLEEVRDPLKGLGIGKRKRWLIDATTRHHTAPKQRTLFGNPQDGEMTPEEREHALGYWRSMLAGEGGQMPIFPGAVRRAVSWLDIACPYPECPAGPGQPCRPPGHGKAPRRKPHKARASAARRQTGDLRLASELGQEILDKPPEPRPAPRIGDEPDARRGPKLWPRPLADPIADPSTIYPTQPQDPNGQLDMFNRGLFDNPAFPPAERVSRDLLLLQGKRRRRKLTSKDRDWWIRSFGSFDVFLSHEKTKKGAIARAALNEEVRKMTGAATDADEERVRAALAAKLAPKKKRRRSKVRLSSLLDQGPPGGWSESDRVNPPDDEDIAVEALILTQDVRAGDVSPEQAEAALPRFESWATTSSDRFAQLEVKELRRAIQRAKAIRALKGHLIGRSSAHFVGDSRRTGGMHVVAHPATRLDAPAGSWQITRFSPDMEPLGHAYRGSFEAAIDYAWREYGPLTLIESNPGASR